jgi:membrane protease YdiL (CAAX protease family)
MSKADDSTGPSAAMAGQPPAARDQKPWGLIVSLVLFLILFGAMSPAYDAILSATGLQRLIDQSPRLHDLNNFTAWALKFLIIVLAVRLTAIPLHDYLGYNRPRVSDVALGVGVVLAIFGIVGALALASGNGPGFVAEYRAEIAKGTSPWWFVLRWWPAIFLASFVEESFFRGFMWRGIEAYHGRLAALLVTSLLFAGMHYNYYMIDGAVDVPSVVQYLLFSFIFGWLRWRSGGTTAPIIAHAVSNASLQVLLVVASALVP